MTMDPLAQIGHVVAVVAHPDDESFGLGGIIGALVASGIQVDVLCLTHGEASTLGHRHDSDLGRVRADELVAAGAVLGVGRIELLDHPDGGLSDRPLDELAAPITAMVRKCGAQALLGFDDTGVTGHPDHRQATRAAGSVAARAGLALYGWAIPEDVASALNTEFGTDFAGHPRTALDFGITVDRVAQRRAIACHTSQATDNPVLWRRLELSGDTDHLRRLS